MMSLEDVSEHADNIRAILTIKKRQLDHLITGQASIMEVRYQIECLEPRLDELDRQVRRMTKERDARESAPLAVIAVTPVV